MENIRAANSYKLWATAMLAPINDSVALAYARVLYHGRYGTRPSKLFGMAVAATICTQRARTQLGRWLLDPDNGSLYTALIAFGAVNVLYHSNEHDAAMVGIKAELDSRARQ